MLLTVPSLGLYIFPHIAQMLCFVDAVNGRPVSRKRARLHTLGLFVPFYNLAMWHHLTAQVRQKLGPDDGMLGPNAIVFLVMATGVVERLLPGWWSVVTLLPLLAVLLTIQAALNACCERAQNNPRVQAQVK